MKRTTCLLFGLCVIAWGVTGSLAVAGEADKNAEQEVYRLLLALPTGYEIKPENMATLARLEALGDQITPHLRTALKKITAQNLGEDADAWRNWWNANGKSER